MEKLAVEALIVEELQKRVVKAYEMVVEELAKVNKDNFLAKDLIRLGEKLKKVIEMKKIDEKVNREVESKIGNKKQVVNSKILKIVRIIVICRSPIVKRNKVDLEKIVRETIKLLDMLAQINKTHL